VEFHEDVCMLPAPQLDGLPTTVPYRPARISVRVYNAMLASGEIAEDDPIELLDGVLVEPTTKNPPHVIAVRQGDLALSRMLPSGWHVRNQDPIALSTSVPEPDLVVARGRLQDYGDRHPGSADIGLVIEIAEASLMTDRYKASLYATAGIPVYWLVNLVDESVEVYSRPETATGTYADHEEFRPGDSVVLALDGLEVGRVSVSDILP
jgi:Uma2 family endonuclease